jgi:hypothetical protein
VGGAAKEPVHVGGGAARWQTQRASDAPASAAIAQEGNSHPTPATEGRGTQDRPSSPVMKSGPIECQG